MILENADITKSRGPEAIHPLSLQKLAEPMSHALHLIFKMSVNISSRQSCSKRDRTVHFGILSTCRQENSIEPSKDLKQFSKTFYEGLLARMCCKLKPSYAGPMTSSLIKKRHDFSPQCTQKIPRVKNETCTHQELTH